LPKIISSSNHSLASQHILGKLNMVTDWLSYAGDARGGKHPLAPEDPSDQELTRHFHLFLPTQIPQNLSILPLPNKVLSWLTQVLLVAESSLSQSRKRAMRNKTASGVAGSASAPSPGLQ
jgi:hypothetical protein